MGTPADELRRADDRWRVDVDAKLDRLIRFADKYESFIQMLSEREGERKVLRRAVIEKSLGALILSLIGIIGVALYHYAREMLHLK